MDRIKKEYIGKRVIKGSTIFILREDMTEKEIKHIKTKIPFFVENIEVIEVIDDSDDSDDSVLKEELKKNKWFI